MNCTLCNSFGATLNNSAFKTWAASSGVIFWAGCMTDKTSEERTSGTGCNWTRSAGQRTYPFVRLYWKDKSNKVRVDHADSGCDLLDGKRGAAGSKQLVKNLKAMLKGYSPPFKLFNVTFKDWDGAVLKAAQTVRSGNDATPPDDPTRAGYEFTGWEPGYTGITAATTCVAQYKVVEPPPPPPQPDDPDDPDEPPPEEPLVP